MEGDTFINGKRIGSDETFSMDGIWQFLAPRVDIKVENTPWFGGKTKVTTRAVHHKGVSRTEVKYLDVNEKPVKIGSRLFGGVVIKRVAPKT